MDTAKTAHFDSFVYTNNHFKEIKNKKHVNSKPKVLSNTMLRISRFRSTDIHRRTDGLGQ